MEQPNITLFVELMDGIFWEGYAQQLSAEDPARFQFELKEFYTAYN